ncbi:MAG: hypothetical protein EBX40_02665 [Gammaproteobacteria bacterium]|nr:hypothetical protein [Gammaproteobacteria bacterium]
MPAFYCEKYFALGIILGRSLTALFSMANGTFLHSCVLSRRTPPCAAARRGWEEIKTTPCPALKLLNLIADKGLDILCA